MHRGVIAAYRADIAAGIIRGDDAILYYFDASEWMSSVEPQRDMRVIFETGPGDACNVRLEATGIQ